MMTKHALVDDLNFRSGPESADNVYGSLHLGQAVKITGTAQNNTWLPATATINDARVTGFVSSEYLRDPQSAGQERLIAAAIAEWLKFDRGGGKEYDEPYFRHIGEYWRAIGLKLDGRNRDQPWSAAFISYVVRRAGGYDGFLYAPSHSIYVNAAINHKINGAPHPFWGFRITEHAPAPGDMVCRWRETQITYDKAQNSKYFKSHCDIVVAVEGNQVITIGGNVADSVSITRYPIDANGYLTGEKNVYAVLGNNV